MKNDINIFILQNQEMFDHAEFKKEAADGIAHRCKKLSADCDSFDSVRLFIFSSTVKTSAAIIPFVELAERIGEEINSMNLDTNSGDLPETDDTAWQKSENK